MNLNTISLRALVVGKANKIVLYKTWVIISVTWAGTLFSLEGYVLVSQNQIKKSSWWVQY